MFDACVFGGLFKGCQLDYSLFWAAVSASATSLTGWVIYKQLRSLSYESKIKSAESYLTLLRAASNIDNSSSLPVQLAAIRAIKSIEYIDHINAKKDFSIIFNELSKKFNEKPADNFNFPVIKEELESTIKHLSDRIR